MSNISFDKCSCGAVIVSNATAVAALKHDNDRLRMALKNLVAYAEIQVAAFSSARPFLDMSCLPILCREARSALDGFDDLDFVLAPPRKDSFT